MKLKEISVYETVLLIIFLVGLPGAVIGVGRVMGEGATAFGLPSWAWQFFAAMCLTTAMAALIASEWRPLGVTLVMLCGTLFVSGFQSLASPQGGDPRFTEMLAGMTHAVAWVGAVGAPAIAALFTIVLAYEELKRRGAFSKTSQ